MSKNISVGRNLLNYKNFDEYLDSLVTNEDLVYLTSWSTSREISKLGIRSSGETISKESFDKRLRAVKNIFLSIHRPYVFDSELAYYREPLERELAMRERDNRHGRLSTIIYLRQLITAGRNYEISAYIDFADRLKNEDWIEFFKGNKKIQPRQSDLSYYNWHMSKSVLNSTNNYQPIIEPKTGLSFSNLHDRNIISVDPSSVSPGIDTTRVRIYSSEYEHIVLYDHVVRSR